MADKANKVIVTGATGFMGAHVVQRLLGKRYTVRACVREGEKAEAAKWLCGDSIEDRTGLLEICECDLLQPESFNSIFKDDCVAVIHCGALPFVSKRDPKNAEHVVNQHVKVMQNLLQLCQYSGTITTLVLCSCLLAVTDEYVVGKTYTELDWNETSSLTRRVHAFAKTQAERLAVTFAAKADCSFKLAAMLPATLLGPHLKPGGTNQAYDLLLHFLEGRINGIPNVDVYVSDVRDCANALVLAMERPEVSGRYIVCAERPMSLPEMLQVVVENFGDMAVPTRKLRDFVVRAVLRNPITEQQEWMLHNVGRSASVDTSRAREGLGVSFRDPRYSVVDTVSYLRSANAIKPVASPTSCTLL